MNGYLTNDINVFRVLQMNYQPNEAASKTQTQAKPAEKTQVSGTDFSRMLATEMKRFV